MAPAQGRRPRHRAAAKSFGSWVSPHSIASSSARPHQASPTRPHRPSSTPSPETRLAGRHRCVPATAAQSLVLEVDSLELAQNVAGAPQAAAGRPEGTLAVSSHPHLSGALKSTGPVRAFSIQLEPFEPTDAAAFGTHPLACMHR